MPENPIFKVIFGSATGTMIEWYDFYIFGLLTTVLAVKFYPPGNATLALIAYLATFAVGFLVRPSSGVMPKSPDPRFAFLVDNVYEAKEPPTVPRRADSK